MLYHFPIYILINFPGSVIAGGSAEESTLYLFCGVFFVVFPMWAVQLLQCTNF